MTVFLNFGQTSKILEVFVKFNSVSVRWKSGISMAA